MKFLTDEAEYKLESLELIEKYRKWELVMSKDDILSEEINNNDCGIYVIVGIDFLIHEIPFRNLKTKSYLKKARHILAIKFLKNKNM